MALTLPVIFHVSTAGLNLVIKTAFLRKRSSTGQDPMTSSSSHEARGQRDRLHEGLGANTLPSPGADSAPASPDTRPQLRAQLRCLCDLEPVPPLHLSHHWTSSEQDARVHVYRWDQSAQRGGARILVRRSALVATERPPLMHRCREVCARATPFQLLCFFETLRAHNLAPLFFFFKPGSTFCSWAPAGCVHRVAFDIFQLPGCLTSCRSPGLPQHQPNTQAVLVVFQRDVPTL